MKSIYKIDISIIELKWNWLNSKQKLKKSFLIEKFKILHFQKFKMKN